MDNDEVVSDEENVTDEGFKGFFQPCYLTQQESLAGIAVPKWNRRWFVFNVRHHMLVFYEGKGGPEKGTFMVAKETQVMPSTVFPKKEDAGRAFLVRTDKKILYLLAETAQARDIKMKELSLTLMHLFSDKKPEIGLKKAPAPPTEEEIAQQRERKALEKKDAATQIDKARSGNLAELDLSNAGLQDWPKEAQTLQAVRTLIISNNKLTKFPDVYKMPLLEDIDVSNNQITNIDIQYLDNSRALTALNIGSNVLWAVPPELTKLSLIQKLDLRKNKLSSLPDTFDRFVKLEELYLAGNQALKAIPKGVVGITSLEILDLSLCGIAQLNPAVTQLTRLLDLNLAKNEIKEIPNLGNMTRLSVLNLSSNSIEEVPLTIAKCGLGKLDLTGNPIKDPELKKEMANDRTVVQYLKVKLQLEESKRELVPKAPVEVKKKEVVYTPPLLKHHVGEMVLKCDELRRNLQLAPSLNEAVPIAQHIRAIKPEIERLRPTLTVEATPAPVIYPTDEKLVALQKTAGAALRDIKNVIHAWHGTLDKLPPPPAPEFAAAAKQVAFCRNALGFKDDQP